MPLSLTGGANAAGTTENKEFYVRKMLRRAQPKLLHVGLADKTFIPKNGGLIVEWRRLSTIASSTTALVEGTAGSETVPTIVKVTATVSQYGRSN